jgi:hypothetical protein
MKRLLNVSRPCYDKFHRCPGWNGGGNRYAKVQLCQKGYLSGHYEKAHWKWRFAQCPECRVYVWPWVTRYVDPTWQITKVQLLPGKISDWRWENRYRRG